MTTSKTERVTDHIVRYENGLACLTSTSIEDAETMARLLRAEGVKDVRVFRRVTETREDEVDATRECPVTLLESTCNEQHKRIVELNKVMIRMESMLCRCIVNEEPPRRDELDSVQAKISNLGVPTEPTHTATTGCKEWLAARGGCARAILVASDGFFVGEHDVSIRFCPWCGEGVA